MMDEGHGVPRLIPPAVMTIEEAAQYLATTPAHVRRMKYEGKIPYTMVGGRIRFRKNELDVWIESRSTWPTG